MHGKQKTSLKANTQDMLWKDMEPTPDLPSSCNLTLAITTGSNTSVLGTQHSPHACGLRARVRRRMSQLQHQGLLSTTYPKNTVGNSQFLTKSKGKNSYRCQQGNGPESGAMHVLSFAAQVRATGTTTAEQTRQRP